MSIAVDFFFICPKNVVVEQIKRVDVDRFRCVKIARCDRLAANIPNVGKSGRAAGLHDEAAATNAIEDTLVLAYDSQYTRDIVNVGDGAVIAEKHDGGGTLSPAAAGGGGLRREGGMGEGTRAPRGGGERSGRCCGDNGAGPRKRGDLHWDRCAEERL